MMPTIASRSLAVIVTLAFSVPLGPSGQTDADAKLGNSLAGSWKLVSAKYGGNDFKFAADMTTIKHVTSAQFMWVTYGSDGKVTRTAGGAYTLKGDTYEEMPEYGMSNDFDVIKGKPQTFKWKVEGNKWFHDGRLSNGLTIEEVWERLEATPRSR